MRELQIRRTSLETLYNMWPDTASGGRGGVTQRVVVMRVDGTREPIAAQTGKRLADVIFLDPPFNIGEPYQGYEDKMPEEEFFRWWDSVLDTATSLLAKDGSLWVNVPDHMAAKTVEALEEISPAHKIQHWCIWHYRFGQNRTGGFIRSKVHVLHFARDGYYKNCEAVLEPSDRAVVYNDQRTFNKKEGTAGMRMPFDVWYGEGFSRIQGNNKERRPLHPNQLPLAYARRVLGFSLKPRGMVLDLFAGSGTFGCVAKEMDAEYLGFDQSQVYADSANERISNHVKA